MIAFTEQEVLTLLKEALALPEDSRGALLESRCTGRHELRRRVEQLLEDSDSPDSFPIFRLERETQTPREVAATGEPELQLFRTVESHGEEVAASVGPYRLIGVLGEGGMGVVYRAQQRQPQREVALKLLLPRYLRSDGFQRRFEREVELLGRLDHPGIARIYDAGAASVDGRRVPYIAMELVAGEPLLEYVERACARLDDKLELIAKIADAVHAAHQRAVVHRDLKPANILVTSSGQPKVLDFGIATSTEMDLDQEHRTQAGELLGTFAYMSPEQARCELDAIDARSDIYTLGLIGYELLAGERAFEHSGGGLELMLRGLERGEPSPLGRVERRFRGDVEAIFGKACRRLPADRYASAAAFADDLRRKIEHRPVSARPLSSFYELRRFVRRNRALVGVLCLFVLAVLTGGIASSVGFLRARRNAVLAQDRAAALLETTDFRTDQLGQMNLERMGSDMRAILIRKLREAAELSGDAQQAERAAGEFESRLAGADFTGLTTELLQAHMFEPSLREIDERFAQRPLIRARLLQSSARTLHDLGLLEAAVEPQARALELLREHAGALDEETLEAGLEMVRLDLSRDDPLHGRPLCESIIETLAGVHGPEHRRTLDAKLLLASLLFAQNDAQAARELEQAVLSIQRRTLGEAHSATLSTMSQLASTLAWLGLFEEACDLQREVLRVQREIQADPEDVFVTMNNLVTTLDKLDERPEARQLAESALELCRSIHGSQHQMTLYAMVNLASVLSAMGDHRAALPYEEQALEGMRSVLGDSHPRTLGTMYNLARTLHQLGRQGEALAQLETVVDVSRRLRGVDDVYTLTFMNGLAVSLYAAGRVEDARELLEETVEARSRLFGDEHPSTLEALGNLVATLEDGEAGIREVQERVLVARRARFGDEHRDTLDSMRNLATTLKQAGDLQEALDYEEQVLEVSRRRFGDESEDTLLTISNMATTLAMLEEYAWARELQEEALATRRRLFGSEDRRTLLSMNNLASTLEAQGERDAATALVSEALAVARRTLQEGNDVRLALEGLGAKLGL